MVIDVWDVRRETLSRRMADDGKRFPEPTRMHFLKHGLIALMVALLPANATRADFVIHDNGVVLEDGLRSMVSDRSSKFESGGEFTLGSAAIISEVRWSGVYFGAGLGLEPPINDFTIAIFAFSGDRPASTPLLSFRSVGDAVVRTATGFEDVSFYPILRFGASIPALDLDPGRYLLSVLADDSIANGLNTFGWVYGEPAGAAPGADGTYFRTPSLSDAWLPNSFDRLDFTLIGTTSAVPEPSSLALCGFAGVAGLGAMFRRRRAAIRRA